MVCVQVIELPWSSVAVQVRFVLLTSLPLSARLSSSWVTVRLLSQASAKVGVPKSAVAGHSTVASAGQFTTVGAVLSVTVKVVVQVPTLPAASVAVTVIVCAPKPTGGPATGE